MYGTRLRALGVWAGGGGGAGLHATVKQNSVYSYFLFGEPQKTSVRGSSTHTAREILQVWVIERGHERSFLYNGLVSSM